MRQYKMIIFFVLVILLAGSGVVMSGLWKDKNTVSSVEFTGNVTLSKDEVFDFAKLNDSIIGTNTLTLEIIEARIAKHPNIKKVNATRNGTVIKIEIQEKDPFAIVVTKTQMYLLDNDMNLYPLKKEQKNLDLPIISGVSDSIDINSISAIDMKKFKTAKYIVSKSTKMDKILFNYISEISFFDNENLQIFSNDEGTKVNLLEYASINLTDRYSPKLSGPEIINANFRREIDRKLLYLYNFLKKVMLYRGSNVYEKIDMRYNDMILVKNKISTNVNK